MKKWKLMPGNPGKAKHIEEELGLPSLVTEVLVARGIDTPAKVKEFITEEIPFSDPMAYKDMDKAADRIGGAVEEGERVCIYGDYDCDGMTATVLLYDYLQSIGCDVWYYIPDRENEGYGLNKEAIDFIAAKETDLIITVDNGISAIEEIDYAVSLGIDVVVTDHHKPREVLPNAVAVVDPHRRDEEENDKIYRDLAGVGVAFKLVCALENDDGWGIAEQYADIVSIGTVADIVPLTGENRILVRQGLSLIPETTNPGLRALVEETGLAGKKLTAEMVAFGIAPKLNSAARLGSAYQVTELLTTEDEERAAELARDLCEQNHRRQELEQDIATEVDKLYAEKADILNDRVVVIEGEGWHHGVIGIVCAKVVEHTGKPCVLISKDGDEARGSARSVEGFSMIEAVSYASDCLNRYGGHPFAAGMSMDSDKVDAFRKKINEFAKNNFELMPVFTQKLDRVMDPAELTVDNIASLKLLEPFGAANEMPVFAFRKVIVDGIYPIGSGKHLRIKFKKAGLSFYAVYFGMTEEEFPYNIGDIVDAAATCELNEFNGETRVSVKIRDIRPSSLSQEKLFCGNLLYDGYKRGEDIPPEDIPERSDIAVIYRYIRSHGKFKGELEVLFGRITGENKECAMDSCKMRLCLDIMEEMGLISRKFDGKTEEIALLPTSKVDIENSKILAALRADNLKL